MGAGARWKPKRLGVRVASGGAHAAFRVMALFDGALLHPGPGLLKGLGPLRLADGGAIVMIGRRPMTYRP